MEKATLKKTSAFVVTVLEKKNVLNVAQELATAIVATILIEASARRAKDKKYFRLRFHVITLFFLVF